MKEKEGGPIESPISRDFNTESLVTIDYVCSEKVAERILKEAEGYLRNYIDIYRKRLRQAILC